MSIFSTRSCQLRIALSLVMLGGLLCTTPALAGELYVLEGGLNQVQVVQTGGNGFPTAVTATIAVGNIAVQARTSPDQRSVWVTNGGDGTITIITTADNNTRLISTAAPGEVACVPNNFPTPCTIPGPFVFNSSGTRVFLADDGDNSVKVIDTDTGDVLKTIPVGNFPAGIAITPDGSKLYVPNLVDNTVSVLSTSSETVLTTITMPGSTFQGSLPASCSGSGATLSGPSPTGIAVTPNGEFAFVTNAYDDGLVPACQPFEPSTVSVIRTANNTVINSNDPILSGGFVASAINFLPGAYPIALVANTGTDAFPDNRIGVISTMRLSLISVITEPAPIIGPAEIDPLCQVTYVPNTGNGAGESIVTLNNSSLSIVNTFTLPSGSFPASIAIVR
jgi:YVTN family beta-propeller protein